MTPATIFGLLLLLANPQPSRMRDTTYLFLTQETLPTQGAPDQSSPSDETKPEQQDKTAQAAQASPVVPKPKPIAPKNATAKTSATKKAAKKRSPSKESPIVVVRNGGTTDSQGQLSSPATDQQTTERMKSTTSLLSATTTNLQKISGKQLNANQQDMVMQIRNYMRQSKVVAANGDVQGANNLAVKAHLLSEELVKP
jgi:hypothetical protein